jgi:hypothetical protein
MQPNSIVQVPVINKTESLFVRDPQNPINVTTELAPEFIELVKKEPMIVTVKTDGTCGIICHDTNNNFYLMRRQDIKIGNRNYDIVMRNGIYGIYSGIECFITKMVRGSGKSERTVPLYIFQLTDDHKPEIEFNHMIGFTPLLHDFAEDKYVVTAIEGLNGTPDLKLATTVFGGTLDIPVRVIAASELLSGQNIMTVEILGSKISNRYGFKNDKHFINPHGSIIYPKEIYPMLDFNSLLNWFKSDSTNRWSDVEGIVIHFPSSGRRFKLHRGHLGLEHTWKSKKISGILFHLE